MRIRRLVIGAISIFRSRSGHNIIRGNKERLFRYRGLLWKEHELFELLFN